MREGFTTGSCAAAAAKAAAYMLLCGERLETVDINVPRGDLFRAEFTDVMLTKQEARCAVKKDGGDDPDITSGMLIYASVSYPSLTEKEGISIHGGEGIGVVTKPGLDQPVGEAAINSVPRQMIKEAVSAVCELAGYEGGLDVTISAPEGRRIAERTFNPRLGIEGGISIIGTSGVVEPMSDKAVKYTIYTELRQRRAMGETGVVIAPGNCGRQFLMEHYGYDLDRAVKCSNFIGDTVDMCRELGFSELILAGHTGKLVKVAAGIMNTHSRESDCRLETIAAAGIRAGLPGEVLIRILDSVSTTEALGHIRAYDEAHQGEKTLDKVMSTIVGRVKFYIENRAERKMGVEATIYCSEIALVSETAHMRDMLGRIMGD
ncbi:MAG: cobalamin biosynthesis protein CbiD [Lachnospiraceae bacterium]|nr:cobalamin biosynthesis protein CbiD [Lachnospiraceae bacterium]